METEHGQPGKTVVYGGIGVGGRPADEDMRSQLALASATSVSIRPTGIELAVLKVLLEKK